MIKYTGYAITFTEVPDEVSLCFNISNCQGKCKGCHSPYLRDDIGSDLEDDLSGIIAKNADNITCVCFLGEGNDPDALGRCIQTAKTFGMKTCLYSGRDDILLAFRYPLDYLKTGGYIEAFGGLCSESTNQRFYRVVRNTSARRVELIDCTYRFWRKEALE